MLVVCLLLSCVWPGDPMTVAHQFPLSMEFSRQEYWSELPFPSPGDLPNPGIKPRSLTLQADSLPAELQGKPKNTGVGSLSILQGIFLTQESTGVSCIAGGYFTNWAIRVGNVSIISHNCIFAEKSYQRSLEQKWTFKGSVYAWIRLPILHSKRKNPAYYLLR